ncbi:hypothetical protein HJC23_011385 [Cyclotella cryptica]|uniref:DUF1995 domain-containing protein n=1 Tax=Cyclotella cryptica TaxID=29204 RepID=A0ABD3PPE2_9STRA|eukprot:CCRYP_012677-RA/>CCRYP_012677-RA protein AED:0.19 eAED:0.19 QI:381/1/1/1/0.5/0.33/3/1540/377
MKLQSIFLVGSFSFTAGFTPPACSTNPQYGIQASSTSIFLSAETTMDDTGTTANINDSLKIPLSYNEMITQTSQAMSDAYNKKGYTRQIVRILLPRDSRSGQLGEYYENEAQTDRGMSQEMKLVPTDESWQGGIMQLYRSASPTAKDILRQLSPTGAATGVPPKIIEDRSIDESGVDGVGLLYTQSGGSTNTNGSENISNDGGGFGFGFGQSVSLPTLAQSDMCFFVQPTQETVEVIEKLSWSSSSSSSEPSPLIALLNPQWRNVDDALDSASKSDSVFGAFASFLGGKGSSLRKLEALGYTNTFTLEGYVCKGGNVRLIKRFDSDWLVFAENDNGDNFIQIGMSVERPSYQDVEKMLNDKGVGYKYARDLGLAPKL